MSSFGTHRAGCPARLGARFRRVSDEHPYVPGLPDVRDEAADTPMWVPMLGFALLLVVGLAAVYQAYATPEIEVIVLDDEDSTPEEAPSAAPPSKLRPIEAAPPQPQ